MEYSLLTGIVCIAAIGLSSCGVNYEDILYDEANYSEVEYAVRCQYFEDGDVKIFERYNLQSATITTSYEKVFALVSRSGTTVTDQYPAADIRLIDAHGNYSTFTFPRAFCMIGPYEYGEPVVENQDAEQPR